MRRRRPTPRSAGPARFRWGAWLGLLALALNALVPVHIAFDVADALSPPSGRASGRAHGLEWRALALLTGHADAVGKSDNHGKQHHVDCAVCSALGTLAGFAPAAAVVVPLPAAFATATVAAAPAEAPIRAPAAAYLSRAPPLS
jgi:Protein of unknown function (DUF2946)